MRKLVLVQREEKRRLKKEAIVARTLRFVGHYSHSARQGGLIRFTLCPLDPKIVLESMAPASQEEAEDAVKGNTQADAHGDGSQGAGEGEQGDHMAEDGRGEGSQGAGDGGQGDGKPTSQEEPEDAAKGNTQDDAHGDGSQGAGEKEQGDHMAEDARGEGSQGAGDGGQGDGKQEQRGPMEEDAHGDESQEAGEAGEGDGRQVQGGQMEEDVVQGAVVHNGPAHNKSQGMRTVFMDIGRLAKADLSSSPDTRHGTAPIPMPPLVPLALSASLPIPF